MAKKHSLTLARINQVVQYDPLTGLFTHKIRRRRRGKPGERAGHVGTNGYRYVGIDNIVVPEHHLAWLCVYGTWPKEIDHIDRVKGNNAILNLRDVAHHQNHQNKDIQSNNKSGRTGVCFTAKGRWAAFIGHHRRIINLGLYDTIVDAVAERMRAERLHFTHRPA